MSILRVQQIRTFEELDALRDIWTQLENVDGGTSVFQSWIWNRTWCDYFLSNRKQARLDVRLLEDGAGHILAILPFFEESFAGHLVNRVCFLANRENWHNDVLLAEPQNQELAASVIMTLRRNLGSRTVVQLSRLKDASTFTQQLIRAGLAERHSCYVWLPADQNSNNVFRRMSRVTRKRFRNKMNKLRREYNVDFAVRSGAAFREAFDELVELHSDRLATKGTSTLLTGRKLDFMRNISTALNELGLSEIVQLRANDKTIAANLTLRHGNIYYSLKGGFDPSFHSFSPMHLLDAESIRHGFEDLGCNAYEYGGGTFEYKFDWHPEVGVTYYCFLGEGSYYARSVAALYRMIWRRLYINNHDEPVITHSTK